MNLLENDLLKTPREDADPVIERILWKDDAENIVTIDIYFPEAVPVIRNSAIISGMIDDGKLEKITEDPYGYLLIQNPSSAKHMEIREKAWEMISEAALNEPDIYYKDIRGALLKDLARKFNASHHTIYKYLRRYWQRGKNKNTLLPDFGNCGGKGKDKTTGEAKLGRPRKLIDIRGAGINVDETIEKIFEIATELYYLTPERNTLEHAYELMMKEYFTEDYTFENGIKMATLVPAGKRPTREQYRTWFKKRENIQKTIISRFGPKKFDLNYRPVLGRSEDGLMGPGSKFQIDATVADVYLLSDFYHDRIIGRPVIYAIIDTYSRMIAGLYVGLKGPSWEGASMAISNMVRNKVDYCAEYGIVITEDLWPCRHLPESMICDRGEMLSKKIEVFANTLHIKIENTPSYRGDLKGIVEQNFRTIGDCVKPFAPGYIDKDYMERGAPDYRLQARMTVYQFTKMIIKIVLKHNNHTWMDRYYKEEIMIPDYVDPVPLKIWNWGIEKRSGRLRTADENTVRLSLMLTDKATVTERGIRFRGMFYKCDRAFQELWFVKARNQGSYPIEISYEPNNMDNIYILSDGGRQFDKCYLVAGRSYKGKTLEDIEFHFAMEKINKAKNEQETLQAKINLYSDLEEIKKESISEYNRKVPVQKGSKASRIKDIRKNRAKERLMNREKEVFHPEEKGKGPRLMDNRETGKDDDDLSGGLLGAEYFRKKQKESLEGNDE